MLDLDLEDSRVTPRPRAARQPTKSRAGVLYSDAPIKTEGNLRDELEELYQSLCNLHWTNAAVRAERCAKIWFSLPEAVRGAMENDFPEAPQNEYGWRTYAVCRALQLHHQAPAIDVENERLDVCPF